MNSNGMKGGVKGKVGGDEESGNGEGERLL
jgi:hypothetical protein